MERTSTAASSQRPLSVAVCICTCRRPQMIAALLERIREEADRVSDYTRVGVVVVDDDPEKSAETAVKRNISAFDLGIRYIPAGSRNIAIARNLAIRGGIEMAGLIALIDDDCTPGQGWLAELLRVHALGDAEMVTGVCIDRFPEAAPPWVHQGPYFDPPLEGEDGEFVTEGYMKNMLLAADAICRSDIQFDPDFGRTGGEDAMFMIQAQKLGFRNRRAARAVVYEQVPAQRLTLKYQLRRRFWYGNTEALTTVASGSATRLRALLRGGRMIAAASTLVPMRLVRRQPAEAHSAMAVFLQGLGRMLGALGISINHR
ncbi:MAG TPA: glycosyltransferase [Hyphomicrobium sp.]|nr:glycosyltransferase [Hyphomicrobium sp.]HRQ25508.1 glycosyltransferase [Hyphomicrobium sp.]